MDKFRHQTSLLQEDFLTKAVEKTSNSNGNLSLDHFCGALSSCGYFLSPCEMRCIFVAIDSDDKGSVHCDGVLAAIDGKSKKRAAIGIVVNIYL
jgi:Ca2+-binding EF-hand superfamily protein